MQGQRPSLAPLWAHHIRAIAFDMDGLLVNTETLYSNVSDTVLKRRGRRFTSELKNRMMGLPAKEAFQVMIAHEELTDSVATLQGETEEEFRRILADQLELMPGVRALLDFIDERGLPRCIATSSTHAFAAEVLHLTNLAERFDFVVTAEDVLRGKPSGDIYLLAAEKMSVPANQMLVLEDSQHGSAAGVASGACTIAVPSDHSESHNFSACFFTANTLADPRIYQVLEHA